MAKSEIKKTTKNLIENKDKKGNRGINLLAVMVAASACPTFHWNTGRALPIAPAKCKGQSMGGIESKYRMGGEDRAEVPAVSGALLKPTEKAPVELIEDAVKVRRTIDGEAVAFKELFAS